MKRIWECGMIASLYQLIKLNMENQDEDEDLTVPTITSTMDN